MPMIVAVDLSETSVHLFSWLKSGKEIFPFIDNVHIGSGAQLASYLNGYRVSLLGVKKPGCEDDRFYLSSNDVKNERRYNSSLPNASIKWKWGISRYVWNADTCMRFGTLIVAIIYWQLIQNRYMFRSFTVLQCSHQHCVQPVVSDVEVLGYL